MKTKNLHFVLFLCLFTVFLRVNSQEQGITPHPYIDERVELLSTVFRLAGADEYSSNNFLSYTKEVDSFFAPYKEHEVIKYVPYLRQNYGVSYDAVMSYATHIEIMNKEIQFKENLGSGSLEYRWTKEDAEKFMILLNGFYKESSFHSFFSKHKPLRDTVENRFTGLLKQINFNWFEQYYGQKPKGEFYLVVSLLNGPGNYGSTVKYKDGKEEIYAIIGTWSVDSLGFPLYSNSVIPTIIHEFNHSFCNPLMIADYAKMKPVADKFFKLNEEKLRQQAYGNSQTLLCEILVRASVIKYLQSEGAPEGRIRYEVTSEKGSGFIWIDKLVDLLDIYEKSRLEYPTLESFMPQIINLQNSLSPKKLQKEFDRNCADIKTSIKNNAKNVNPNTKEIIITFNKPMYTGANGASWGKGGRDLFPKILGANWNKTTKKQWIIQVDLESDTEYSMSFPGQFFFTEEGYPAKTYFLDFKTAKNR